MSENRIMQQVTTIFSVFMVFFYIGVGIFLIFYMERTIVDKPVRVILGSTFLLYGFFRAFRAYMKIVEVFFKKDEKDKFDKTRYNR
jgi:hypothetical protein